MRLPSDYHFTSVIKDQNDWVPKKRRIEKIREEELGQELEEALHPKESEMEKSGGEPTGRHSIKDCKRGTGSNP